MKIEFWFEFASTYSYLSALRLPAAAKNAGVEIVCAASASLPNDILQRATLDANKHALRNTTEEAIKRGIFGAPSFIVGEELFWGDDRLDEALSWAAQHG